MIAWRHLRVKDPGLKYLGNEILFLVNGVNSLQKTDGSMPFHNTRIDVIKLKTRNVHICTILVQLEHAGTSDSVVDQAKR